VGHGHRAHAGGAGGGDAVGGVLDGDAVARVGPQPLRGQQVDLRVGLAAVHVLTRDHGGERRPDLQAVEHVVHVGTRARAGDGQPEAGGAQAVDRGVQARHGLDPLVEEAPEDRLTLLEDLVGREAEALGQGVGQLADPAAHHVVEQLGVGLGLGAEAGQVGGGGALVDGLGVDYDPVHVEHDVLGDRHGRQRRASGVRTRAARRSGRDRRRRSAG
jgi:hypothetical protein